MKRFTVLILLFCLRAFAGGIADYEYLPFLDENLKIGLGMSYSKLEANSDVGNYYLLSAANPKLEVSYSSPVKDLYRHRFSGGVEQELFRPENDTFFLKTRDSRTAGFLSWEPIWLNEDRNFEKRFKFMIKNGTVISEIPNGFSVNGDVGDRFAADVGLGFTWYGLTVSKFPLGFGAEVLYTQTLFDHSVNSVYSGLSYRMSLDFEFKKRSLFSGWGTRGYYEYDDLSNDYSHVVHKEIGIIFSKAFVF
jgi:hypothetical protein